MLSGIHHPNHPIIWMRVRANDYGDKKRHPEMPRVPVAVEEPKTSGDRQQPVLKDHHI